MAYRHRFRDRSPPQPPPEWAAGKVVCVGRNYVDHARELNNDIPGEPLLFIKPGSAIRELAGEIAIPPRYNALGAIHYETEMCLLLGQPLSCAEPHQVTPAIAGIGVGLDLTLREVQADLKVRGHPWERAKAFDGSCLLSAFAPMHRGPVPDLANLAVRLWRNGELVQDGNTGEMLFPAVPLLCNISRVFSLQPGDVVMTGTPAGVGQLHHGDHLVAETGDLARAEATIVFR